MLDLSTARPTKTTNLADLLRCSSSSSDIFTNYYEPIRRGTLTFTTDDARATDDGSGDSTPPLWRSSSPTGSPDRDQTASTLYSSLSPRSRTQAIARGQMELMEMVKNMPESCYELSLKDLVETNHRYQGSAGVKTSSELRVGQRNTGGRRIGAQQQVVRSNSNGGFLLKMVVPVSWGARKKKTTTRECSVNGSTSLRAFPVSDKEWWTKRKGGSVSASMESESVESSLNSESRKSSSSSSRSSSTNGSSSRRYVTNGSSRRFEEMSDCWSFIRMKKPNP